MVTESTDDAHEEFEIEPISSEEEDRQSSPVSYEILTYPADYTLEGLVAKWQKKTLTIPQFQRRYVWTQNQASKLIESFLLGLPVPPIFLFTGPKQSDMLVVDGQQRLRSVAYFFEGYFGEEDTGGKRPVFRLTGLNERSPYSNKSFKDIEESDPTAFQRFKDAVLRSFVIKQLNPDDDTSIYHVFERLNTGGTSLQGQEIRNCIYHGKFNDLLLELNRLPKWRDIFGKQNEDKRQRDVELILRFFALHYELKKYRKPMKDFMSHFMSEHRNGTQAEMNDFRSVFVKATDIVHGNLGARPFHIKAGLNAAVYDSTYTAIANHRGPFPSDLQERYKKLIEDSEFIGYATVGTTDETNVTKRFDRASKILLGK